MDNKNNVEVIERGVHQTKNWAKEQDPKSMRETKRVPGCGPSRGSGTQVEESTLRTIQDAVHNLTRETLQEALKSSRLTGKIRT